MSNAKSLADALYDTDPKNRPAVVAFPDSGEREVLRQLARRALYDGDLCSKSSRDVLVAKGLVGRCQGLNFLTQDGYAVVDALWGIETFIRP